jgi:type 2 lantibiotic biosynthesis protein LanM
MRFTTDELRLIVERSTTLQERLRGDLVAAADQNSASGIPEWAEKWRAILGGDDAEDFLAKRLEWDGLDVEALSRTAAVRLRDDHVLPGWTVTLNEVMDEAAKGFGSREFLDDASPRPFQEIFVPFVGVAARALRRRLGDRRLGQLSEKAFCALKRSLLSQITLVCFSALEAEFSVFRVARQRDALKSAIKLLSNENSTELYSEFLREMFAGELKRFFQEYAVLARCTMDVINRWVGASDEFMRHLAEDRATLQREFNAGDLGPVRDLKSSLSDPHNGGRTVIGLTFECGLQLIYKPRSLGVDKAYFALLDWLNRQDSALKLRVLKVIDRGEHGWVEHCVASPCTNVAAMGRFYRRSGMVLCLVHALRGTDLHSENVLACGDQPVIVDLETLLTPDVGRPLGTKSANQKAARQLRNSVINTQFLPQWQSGGGSDAISDRSALGAIDSQLVEYRRLKYVNTDRMALLNVVAPLDGGQGNSPFANESGSASLGDYVEDIVSGFSEMYGVLVRCREALLSPGSPLENFRGVRLRLVIRPTALYFAILVRSLAANATRDGAARSLEFEVLCRAFLGQRERPTMWGLVADEQRSLERLDIPAFEFRSDSLEVGVRGAQGTHALLAEAGYAAMRKRLEGFDESDLDEQTEFIRGSLCSRLLFQATALQAARASSGDEASRPLATTELIARADTIGQEILRRGIRGDDGSLTWISVNYDFGIDRHQFSAMGPGLYAGVFGVALFLAALEKMRPTGEYKDACLRALKTWREFFREPESYLHSKLVGQMGLGVGGGLGGMVYAQACIYKLLGEPELLEDAKRVASFITKERIEADRDFDILSGGAGTILALLKLHGLTNDPEFLSTADKCGQHLLRHRTACKSGPRAWVNMGNPKPLTGFSHGAAGIAYALLRLFETTREFVYLDAAREGIDYETTVFSSDLGNWADLRPNRSHGKGPAPFMTSWCHGAPGIGLARVRGLSALDTEGIRGDIEAALRTTLQFGVDDVDHLCCGNLGRVEFLLTASELLNRPELRQAATIGAATIAQRADNFGAYRLLPKFFGPHFNAGLFQGVSGIGYEFLRLADGKTIPSVLLLD